MPNVARKHHALVRLSHWLTVPVLLGLILSGFSIYWASPVHPRVLGNGPGTHWFYDHFSLGWANLARALRVHWLLAYLFMLCGLLYVIGLIAGGGWRALVPGRGHVSQSLAMVRYYAGIVPMRLRRKRWPHPHIESKYNALQKTAYASMPLFGLLAVASGWAMHKPVQLGWLARLFGSYDGARVVHFWAMWVFIAFVIPHVILVIVDGWDTFRSMVIGWTLRVGQAPSPVPVEVPDKRYRNRTRRDFVLFGAGAIAAIGGLFSVLPNGMKRRLHGEWLDSLEARLGWGADRRERTLNRVLTFDDDVAEALYSKNRSVRTYAKSDVTDLRNNYNGRTPGPDYLPAWTLTLSGLASGNDQQLTIADLLRMPHREQITRLCCVEGWSAIAWWGGLRFADLLRAYPPAPGMRWAAIESAVNLDGAGNPDPYYVSIDLPTAEHAQTLLATHQNGRPLTLAHGAPLRLVVPMKLGLKNIKAITKIAYVRDEPADYWAERGYSKYDGL
jgi:DMSO/TMAO reductase YedYZ molybdopterin-dependent catalytic subunit/thiosulfate reductase cytochrome b subunit